MAQLAVRGSAPRVDRVVLREGERVEVPARQPHDARVPQRLDAAGRRLGGAAAVAELPLLPVPPAVELALRGERKRVRPVAAREPSDRMTAQGRLPARRADGVRPQRPQRAAAALPPRKDVAAAGECEGVRGAECDVCLPSG